MFAAAGLDPLHVQLDIFRQEMDAFTVSSNEEAIATDLSCGHAPGHYLNSTRQMNARADQAAVTN